MKDKILIGAIVVLSGLVIASNVGRVKNLITSKVSEDEVSPTYELSEAEQSILYYEQLEANGQLTQDDYYTLAQLYLDDGLRKDARDLLEQSYRLNGDQQSLTMLADIVVNSQEESAEVNNMLQTSIMNCQSEDFDYTATSSLLSDEVFQVLMPKLEVGTRSYYYTLDGNLYYLTLTCLDDGSRYLKTAIYNSDDSYSQIVRVGDEVQWFTCENYKYRFSGLFTLKTANMNSDAVTSVSGSLDKNLLNGEFIVDSDVEYIGSFENGVATIEQPDEDVIKNLISGSEGYTSALVYAMDESKEQALWVGLTSEDEEISFGIENLKVDEVVIVDEYTPGTNPSEIVSTVDASNFRIYDGVLQCFDGTYWVNVDTITNLAANDPFTNLAVASNADTESEEEASEDESQEENATSARLTLISVFNTGRLTTKNTTTAKTNSDTSSTTSKTTSTSTMTTNTATTTYVASSSSSSNDTSYSSYSSNDSGSSAAAATVPAASAAVETPAVVTPAAETPAAETPAADASASSDSSNETEISYDDDWGPDIQ